MLMYNIFYFILSCAFLVVSGIYLVKSLSKISRFLGISEFSAAFIIMAFATSIPELFVGISSALSGNPELSLGNIIGANILDLTLIMGIIILASRGIKLDNGKIGNDVYYMLSAVLLIVILYFFGMGLSRVDGGILLCFFAFNVFRIFRKRKKYKSKIKGGRAKNHRFFSLLIFIISLIVLFVSSKYVVEYASALAVDLNFPKIVIGLLLLSFATTLPELVFGISASNMKHKQMGVGDQLGTIVANSTLILGLVALISPIKADFTSFLTSSMFLILGAGLFVIFTKTGKYLDKREGIWLILIYVIFVIVEFFLR